jgi:hypothetical protein
MREQVFANNYIIKSYEIKGGFLVRLHNTFLCKYCEKVIGVVLDYRNSDGITFVTTLIMTTNFQQCKYCKLGIEKKIGHAHNQCLHIMMKVLLVTF